MIDVLGVVVWVIVSGGMLYFALVGNFSVEFLDFRNYGVLPLILAAFVLLLSFFLLAAKLCRRKLRIFSWRQR